MRVIFPLKSCLRERFVNLCAESVGCWREMCCSNSSFLQTHIMHNWMLHLCRFDCRTDGDMQEHRTAMVTVLHKEPEHRSRHYFFIVL